MSGTMLGARDIAEHKADPALVERHRKYARK